MQTYEGACHTHFVVLQDLPAALVEGCQWGLKHVEELFSVDCRVSHVQEGFHTHMKELAIHML
jgi:hypothetical protein